MCDNGGGGVGNVDGGGVRPSGRFWTRLMGGLMGHYCYSTLNMERLIVGVDGRHAFQVMYILPWGHVSNPSIINTGHLDSVSEFYASKLTENDISVSYSNSSF